MNFKVECARGVSLCVKSHSKNMPVPQGQGFHRAKLPKEVTLDTSPLTPEM